MDLRRLQVLASPALAIIVVACGTAVVPPSASPSGSGGSSPSTSQAIAETMDVGVHIPVGNALGDAYGLPASDLPFYSLHPNGSLWDGTISRFIYSGVYRLDENLSPVPDLAAQPCDVSADLVVITCSLREATFHDGTRLTAEDVAFAYQLLMSDACRMPNCPIPDYDLDAVTALGERTVEFRLAEPNPAFFTAGLADVLIEPKARVEQAFTEFLKAAEGTDPVALDAVAARLTAALPPETSPSCDAPAETAIADAEVALMAMGRQLRGRAVYEALVGPTAACDYGRYLLRSLGDAADALRLTGVDAVAAAYRILDFPATPVGSGPWRVTGIEPGVAMQLAAYDGFHRGAPATKHVEIRLLDSTAEAVDAVRTGAVDWLIQPFGSAAVADSIGDAPGIVWASFNDLSYYGIFYNLRDGRLFADPGLRAALELCIDKDETVAAATGGHGVAIHSPISPAMWAYEPDLPHPTRDVRRARELIEASGWTVGADGIYRKGDRRLSTAVPVPTDYPGAVPFVELMAFQVAECGIEMTPVPMSSDDLVVGLDWPHVPPGADQPWDATFSGWITTPDPDYSAIYHSRAITTPDHPVDNNFMGYANPEGDRLMEQSRATYEERERARLFREHQRILATDRPVLFAWSDVIREARSSQLESTSGPLSTTSGTWWWELEKLRLTPPEP